MAWLIAVVVVLALLIVAHLLLRSHSEVCGRLWAAQKKKAAEDQKYYDEVQYPQWIARRDAGLLPSEEEEEDYWDEVEREMGYPIPMPSAEGSRIDWDEIWPLRQEVNRIEDGWRYYIAVRIAWIAIVLGLATLIAGALKLLWLLFWLLLTF